MDPLAIALFGLLWICTTVLAYGTGWVRGYDTATEKHRQMGQRGLKRSRSLFGTGPWTAKLSVC